MICDSMFSWTVYKWEVPHCMQVYWPNRLKFCLCKVFEDVTMVVNGIVFGVKTPIMCLPVPRPPVQSGASVCPSVL